MPFLISIGFTPYYKHFNPSYKIALAITVQVVVPSPLTSFVFDDASYNNLEPILYIEYFKFYSDLATL
jgi:hypothetical protein